MLLTLQKVGELPCKKSELGIMIEIAHDGSPNAPALPTFVLSGGGNLGALQVGMVYVLVESGIRPGKIVGTSVGAINRAFLPIVRI